MGVLGGVLSVIPVVGPILGPIIEGIVSKIPDPNARQKAEAELAGAVLGADLASMQGQIDTNKIEAGHASVFVSGARPFLMWVCGVIVGFIGLCFVVLPALQAIWLGLPVPLPNAALLDFFFWLTSAIAGIRGFETVSGKARASLGAQPAARLPPPRK